MIDFKDLFPKDLYHSYIVEGDPEIVSLELHKYLEERGEIPLKSNDVLIKIQNSFTIADSHKIKEWHSELGISDGKKICIIGAKFINHDAERTLLKIIEEPAKNTHFFLVVPNSLVLLDTIRSRTHIISTINNKNNEVEKRAKEFLSVTPKNRIDLVAKIIKENKDEEGSGNLRFVAIQLINELEKNIFEKFKKNPEDKNVQFVLKELEKNREFLNLPGASVKMILEHLALVI